MAIYECVREVEQWIERVLNRGASDLKESVLTTGPQGFCPNREKRCMNGLFMENTVVRVNRAIFVSTSKVCPTPCITVTMSARKANLKKW